MKTWEELKGEGSEHYRTIGTQPIDLYRDLGILRDFAIGSIIKYASRNSHLGRQFEPRDMDKIIHYAELLKAAHGDSDG